ncbi:ribose transport system permease protein [Spinactinospora alkalitolerans]|uniref:Autoinducer 2 import system permease protein LsrD n=1 Tax=Spinactinospora alkalitolerans TaxID=687207 RepID=A0A852TY03_9ACTN|nr:ABC transporter permease [Spinactinospora alkalitolerans]NYE48215.1 ribose transport system permease protein [Spinactinospora alkalitolerans]
MTSRTTAPVRVRTDRIGTTGLVYLALVAILLGGAALAATGGHNLLGTANVVDMLTRSSLLGFAAIGQTMVILCRSLDLSVGYVMALCSVVAATTMAGDPARIGLGIAAALAVAALIGLVNGLVITRLKVNAFIATLGTGLIIKGYLDTQYKGPAGEVPAIFQAFGYTRIGFVPLSAAVMIAVAVLAVLFLRTTRTGYHMYAVGGDADVARMSGIRVDRPVIAAHVLCSMAAGAAGLLIAARFGTGSTLVYASGYELESIAAVVLGGTYLLGGRGGVAGTVAGVLILAVLDSLFNVLAVDPFFKDVLRGVIVIAAVAIYARRQVDRGAGRPRFSGGGADAGAGGVGAAPPPVPAGREGGRT